MKSLNCSAVTAFIAQEPSIVKVSEAGDVVAVLTLDLAEPARNAQGARQDRLDRIPAVIEDEKMAKAAISHLKRGQGVHVSGKLRSSDNAVLPAVYLEIEDFGLLAFNTPAAPKPANPEPSVSSEATGEGPPNWWDEMHSNG